MYRQVQLQLMEYVKHERMGDSRMVGGEERQIREVVMMRLIGTTADRRALYEVVGLSPSRRKRRGAVYKRVRHNTSARVPMLSLRVAMVKQSWGQ